MQKQTTLIILLSLLPCINILHGSYNIKSTRKSGYRTLSQKQEYEKSKDARSFNGGLDQSLLAQTKPSLRSWQTTKKQKTTETKSPKTVREIMNAAITAAKIA